MNQRSLLLFVLAMLLALQAVPADLRYESKLLGLRFQYPQNFLIGRPTEIPYPREMAEAVAKAGKDLVPSAEESLIEKRFAAGQDLNALKRGSLQILLSRHRGSEAEFDWKFLMKDPFRQPIGAWDVYVLPGAPGPYGDKAFYYLVALEDRSVLEISAPRTDEEEKPTHYDQVIRKLIESLEAVPGQ